MISLASFLLFLSMCLCIYVYVGYPLVLTLLARYRFKLHKIDSDIRPSVSLIISCYNEVEVIHEKIGNSLAIDYPDDKFEIIFVSDGSDDGTDKIVAECGEKNIKLIRQEGRLGKTSALNMAVPLATGDIIVFSDANAMYQSDALKKLVRNFADDSVGYVVGAALYTDGNKTSAAQSENSYWKYEISIKEKESQIHSVVGGDGAIYAIRKILFDPLDKEDINDFVNPLQIILKGYRGIFEKEAICFEETAGEFDKEGRRKQRIVNRSFRGLLKVKEVMNPFRFGLFSFSVISHKLMRWMVPVFLIGILFSSSVLAFYDIRFAELLLFFQVCFFWLASVGRYKSKANNVSAYYFYPYYFLLVNLQSLVGMTKALQGNIQVTWSTSRSALESSPDKVTSTFFKWGFVLSIYLMFIAVF